MNIFQKFIKSISDFKSYKIFKEQSMKKAVLYILPICLILSVISHTYSAIKTIQYSDKVKPIIQENVPNFKIQDNKLIMKDKEIQEFETSGIIVKFDTTDKSKEEFNNIENGMLFYSDGVMVRKNNKEVLNEKYSKVYASGLDSAIIKQAIQYAKPIIIIMYIFMTIGALIGVFMAALVVAVIGLILKKAINYQCSFKTLYKLSLYAMTLPILINACGALAMIRMPYIFLEAIGAFYLYKALKVIKNGEDKDIIKNNSH